MGKGSRYTREQVEQAIRGSGAIVSAIAARLGCSWSTARKLIDRWQTTQAAYEDERQRMLDVAESTIIAAIRDGDVQAAKWYLARIGRDRGYGDAIEQTGTLTVRIVDETDDYDDSSDD